MPNYACPQCPAIFTRASELSESCDHDRGRHNGVVIEPTRELSNEDNQTADDDDARSASPSRSRSGSATPPSKGKEREAEIDTIKHYRTHTASYSSYNSSRSPYMNSSYDQVSLPTSATRLNNTANWSYSHPWPEHLHLPPIGYPHVYYTPSPHYRIDGPPPLLHPVSQVSGSVYTQSKSQSQESSSRTTLSNHPSYTSSERTTTEQSDTGTSNPLNSDAPVVDPSLESNDAANSSRLTEEQVRVLSLEITQAAMQAVMESAKQAAKSSASGTSSAGRDSEDNTAESNDLLFDSGKNVDAALPVDPSASNLTEEHKLNASQRTMNANVDMDTRCDDVREGADGINDYDADAEPQTLTEQSQLLDNDEEAVLSPGRWLSICLR
ncbi:hypothetical protein M378DRAFT_114568 [Amanita muscaria Koide BX008]|uniref:C2H2-type domain-containing protein n=1 Tax=Amanita muscaria (strain Koide BX008) TaxID=946122 RepID=A0A0C2XPB1_AMAMK|nr:hypothetical protein M378DRAFT_114568 [Amanita muscaria Koide BX008]